MNNKANDEQNKNDTKNLFSKFKSLKKDYIPDEVVEKFSKIKNKIADKSTPIVKDGVKQAKTQYAKWRISEAASNSMSFFTKLVKGNLGLAKTTDTIKPINTEEAPKKLGAVLIIFTVLIVLANVFFAFIFAMAKTKKLATMTKAVYTASLHGAITANLIIAFIFPLLIVALFQIGKRFRNVRSIVKIFFWTSFVILLSTLNQLSSLL